MNQDELLAQRFKVIAKAPLLLHEVGDIIKFGEPYLSRFTVKFGGKLHTGFFDVPMSQEEMEQFPAIFKKLHWSHDREIDALPRYVKWKDGTIGKVEDWHKNQQGEAFFNLERSMIITPNYFPDALGMLPADEAEYLAYKLSHPVEP